MSGPEHDPGESALGERGPPDREQVSWIQGSASASQLETTASAGLNFSSQDEAKPEQPRASQKTATPSREDREASRQSDDDPKTVPTAKAAPAAATSGKKNVSADSANIGSSLASTLLSSPEVLSETGQKRDASWSEWMAHVYSWTYKPIIRPPREKYVVKDLGRKSFIFRGVHFYRDDLFLTNPRGHKLACSHFCSVTRKGERIKQHCVVYLHGSCSSRLEVFDVLPVLLPVGLSVFTLDFSGSGQSDGEFISLGWWEEQDVRTVLEHLRSLHYVGTVGLWGRSMGAIAALLRAAEDPLLAVCVLDSPFSQLRTVVEEYLSHARLRIPQFLIYGLVKLVRQEVLARAEFDIEDLAPIRFAPRAKCPVIFAVASDDNFVLPHHTQELHNEWGGERQLRFFDGGHNGRRPKWYLEEAAQYLKQKLQAWRPPVEKAERPVVNPEAPDAKEGEEEAPPSWRRTYWL